MRILVTGAAGFIGNELSLKLLERGHDVLGYDALTDYYDVQLKRDRLARTSGFQHFDFVQARLEDRSALYAAFDRFAPERVYHCAAQAGVRHSLEHPEDYVDANMVGTFNVLEACRRTRVQHLLIASTSSAYGAHDVFPFVETASVPHPLTIYAASKLAGELMAHTYAHLHSLPATMMRFFSVYGPWGRPDMAFFLFTKKILNGEPIDVYGEGQLYRDFTYIDDLVEAMVRLGDCAPVLGQAISTHDSLSPVAPHRIVNIGNAEPVLLSAYIEAIERAAGERASKRMMPMQPGDVARTFADTSLLRDLIGYLPSTQVDDGIQKFVDWYRAYNKVSAPVRAAR